MDAGVSGRLGLIAASLLLFGAGLVLHADSARSGVPGDDLEPDLVVQRPAELYIAKGAREIRLRVSNTVANRGTGPLEITGNGSACDDGLGRRTLQHLYEDSPEVDSRGYFDREDDPSFDELDAGCSRFHAAHDHWHFDNFARYTLLDEDAGKVVGGSRKISFCVIDTGQPYPGLDGSPEDGYYPFDPEHPQFSTCSETSIDGLSIGWEDTYGATLPGQGIKVTDLRRGAYCLVLETDPPTSETDLDGVLVESDEDNNARTIRLRMRPRRGVVNRLGSNCESA